VVSSSLHGYCINVSELRSIVDNPPATLVDELRERFPDEFEPGDPQSGPSAGEALIAFLDGKPILPDIHGRIPQGLELICELRGARIESSFFEEARYMSIDGALNAGMGGGVCERLLEPRLPVPLPTDEAGPPWISYLTREEIEAGLRSPDKDGSGLDPEILDARDDLRVWLEIAKEHGMDLIVFGN
jgi:hypothetical protein